MHTRPLSPADFALAAAVAGAEPFEPAPTVPRTFEVDGRPVTHSELLAANTDDPDVQAWADSAQVGDVYPGFVPCRRTS